MEKCELCSEKGIEAEFKDGRGLGLHLKAKHSGMKLDEYREKYGGEKEIKEPTTQIEIPEKEETLTEEPETPTDEKPQEIVITDYKLLNNSNLSAMFVHDNGAIKGFKKVMAVGTVEFGDNSVVSVLVIGDDGILNPPLWLPNFGRIIENDTSKQPNIKVKRKGLFQFRKKRKEEKKKVNLGKEESEALSEKLMETFQQFSKEKEEEKNNM